MASGSYLKLHTVTPSFVVQSDLSFSLIGFHDLIFFFFIYTPCSFVNQDYYVAPSAGLLGTDTPGRRGRRDQQEGCVLAARPLSTGEMSRYLICLSEAVQQVFATPSKHKRHCQLSVSWAPDYGNSPGANLVNLILTRQRGPRIIIIRPGNFLLVNYMMLLPGCVMPAFSIGRRVSERDIKPTWTLLPLLKEGLPRHTSGLT